MLNKNTCVSLTFFLQVSVSRNTFSIQQQKLWSMVCPVIVYTRMGQLVQEFTICSEINNTSA